MKLNSTALRMWDSSHNQTVYLDGEGKSNVLTGTFQTRVSGHRVRISPDYQSYIIGGTETFVGDGLEFPAYNGSTAFYSHPAIASVIQSNQVGTMSELDLWSGHVTKNDPAAFLRLNSKPRAKGGTGSGITSQAYLKADTNWDEGDNSKKSGADLNLQGVGGSGASAYLNVRSDTGSLCEAAVHSYGSKARAYCTASDANGEVGVLSDISTGYVYLGGYLGGLNGRHTFEGAVAWKLWSSSQNLVTGSYGDSKFSVGSPAKYGRYYAVACADTTWAGIIVHTMNTGGQSGWGIKAFNADQKCTVDVWCDTFGWLVK